MWLREKLLGFEVQVGLKRLRCFLDRWLELGSWGGLR